MSFEAVQNREKLSLSVKETAQWALKVSLEEKDGGKRLSPTFTFSTDIDPLRPKTRRKRVRNVSSMMFESEATRRLPASAIRHSSHHPRGPRNLLKARRKRGENAISDCDLIRNLYLRQTH